jgi:hypothetical protein
MNEPNPMRADLENLIRSAYLVSQEVGQEVEIVLKAGLERPLSASEGVELLGRAVTTLKRNAAARRDTATLAALEGQVEAIVARIVALRRETPAAPASLATNGTAVVLQPRNGTLVRQVSPRPFFHGRAIPVTEGFMRTTDIRLWDRNERLEIHLAQFRERQGRAPNREELLDIMLGRMALPGADADDEFRIIELASSIAVNGVRKPPIIDHEGNLLDGNRRVTACHFILNSSDYAYEQKQRAEYICVWQLSEHATADEKGTVVVSLNFESDCKEPWPEYVKARKVYDEWQAMLSLEGRNPAADRQRELKEALSRKFALGSDTAVVSRYLKMVRVAEEFEEFHTNVQKREEYAVKHKAREFFQYFDELAKGAGEGGVANTLGQHPEYQQLVFDLLYQGKFKNWNLIRNLRFYSKDVHDALVRARDDADLVNAKDTVEEVLVDAKAKQREVRAYDANSRIERFVKWLEELPIGAFRDDIDGPHLEMLVRALQLVERQATAAAAPAVPAVPAVPADS